MSNQLLPCPFCGHDEPTHDEGDQSAWVQCTNFECGMCGPIASGPSLAAAAWNRRATQPAAGEPVAPKRCATIRVNRLDSGRYAPKVMRFDAGQFPDGELIDVYAAPPAAAHADEAVRRDAERYQALRDMTEGLDETVDAMIAEAAAMRAQGDGDSGHE